MEDNLLAPEEYEAAPPKKYCKCMTKKQLVWLWVGIGVLAVLAIAAIGIALQFGAKTYLPDAISEEYVAGLLADVVLPLGGRGAEDDWAALTAAFEESVKKELGAFAEKVAIDRHCYTLSNASATVCNVVVEALAGLEDSVVVVGAHLDAAEGEKGENDNGSGVAAALALLVKFFETGLHEKTVNRVMFGFWGGQKLGNMGSATWISHLSEEERARIVAYMDLDQIGTANSEFHLTNPVSAPEILQAGCKELNKAVQYYYDHISTASQLADFSEEHDTWAFVKSGIASVGLTAVAEGAGDSVDSKTLRIETRAAATGLETLAKKMNLKNTLYPGDALEERLEMEVEVESKCGDKCAEGCCECIKWGFFGCTQYKCQNSCNGNKQNDK